ncbi:YqeB family protein [Prauserella muralis]|uniref:DUF308 domain-containing protein n=1 Tax=Prauserella muralis TaxID=588067 RepID=A0A2V4BB95_9PSEU|nr:hypothetical protein [Prauserella muralis]PXY32607.1 hypothetical protein BAY60_00165 [Prauserella muralis]
MTSAGKPGREVTVIAPSPVLRVVYWTGFPLAGAGVGWLLTWLASWAATLEWVPFQGPLRLLDSLADPLALAGALLLGGGAGLVVAYLGDRELLAVTVSGQEAVLGAGASARRVSRGEASAVFFDGKDLVVLDRSTAELARVKGDLGRRERAKVADAFRAHGWPWHAEGDPHRPAYRRWVEDMPELSASAHALFRARQRALERRDADDAAQLRAELGRLDLVVTDEGQRQFWRRADGGR